MKLDTTIGVDFDGNLAALRANAQQAEADGYDCLWSNETKHDPFWPLMLAAEHTQKIKLGTGIAVAFARSPTAVAQMAWDLQAASNGRFLLGLGTQVKAHIERRFGMPWDHPAPRLRDYILAMRALWHSWQTGEPLNHRGDFYKLTLMTPFFSPAPIAHPDIPVYIAGVNDHLCQLAGELCQGFHVHPFHTPKYLREVVLPNIAIGAAKSGRTRNDVALVSSVFVIGGDTPQDRARERESVRQQVSFYASTPSYRIVMDTHGWGDTAQALGPLAQRGKWDEMRVLITDEMLAQTAVEGSWDEIPAKLHARCDGLLDRVLAYFPNAPIHPAAVRAFNTNQA